jgi:5-methylcytosine-specific restriction endonuclease McrA
VAPDGRRCSARRQLQIDHVHPHARLGGESAANLRLLCQTHNQLAAKQFFGARYMRSVMKRVAVRRRNAASGR